MSQPILVAVSDPSNDLNLIAFAAQVAAALGRELLLVHVITVPEPFSYSEKTIPVLTAREHLEAVARDVAKSRGIAARVSVRVSRDAPHEIRSAAHEEGAGLLICGWGRLADGSADAATGEFGPVAEALLDNPPADLAVVHPPPQAGIRRILVSVRGGPYATLAVDLGSRLAAAEQAEMSTLRVFHREGLEETIIPEARHCDLLIMGAHGPAGAAPPGPSFTSIRARAGCGIMVVRTRKAVAPWVLERPAWTTAAVDKWFAENTFDAREFADMQHLADIKRGLGVTISLGLPALNEAETIGGIIKVMRETLVESVPLLDEIVVIDSGSDDGTPEIARSMGVPVYIHRDILPAHGAFRGKGEALWKSLHVLQGDLIVWLDTDIKNPGPWLVYGLVGPLLRDPRLKYVKGFYSRPIRVGDRVYETGGGRVTELAARPLLNFFFPELSGFIQPLAGQYAGWRDTLERVPFFTGYGVETGLLIDILAEHGLQAMGQVNLGRLMHRNSPLAHLSTMAFAILQVFVNRLEAWGRLSPAEAASKTMKMIRWEDGHLSLDVWEIEMVERPPMATIPEYRLRGTPASRRQ